MIEINWFTTLCIFLFVIDIGLQIKTAKHIDSKHIDSKIVVSHDPVINETIYFNSKTGADTHKAYNKESDEYIFVVSGVYTIKKEFKAGDKIYRPIYVRRD